LSRNSAALLAGGAMAVWVGIVYVVGNATGWLTTGPLKIERFGTLCLILAIGGGVWMWSYYLKKTKAEQESPPRQSTG